MADAITQALDDAMTTLAKAMISLEGYLQKRAADEKLRYPLPALTWSPPTSYIDEATDIVALLDGLPLYQGDLDSGVDIKDIVWNRFVLAWARLGSQRQQSS